MGVNVQNLGAFVGGAMQGQQASNRQRLADQEMAMRQEEMGFRRQEMQARQEERDAAKAIAAQRAQLFQKYYGEQEVPDGEAPVDDGVGGVAYIPKTKKVSFKVGDDKLGRDLPFLMDSLKLGIASGKENPAKLLEIAQLHDQVKRTEVGQQISRVMAGDEKSIAALMKSLNRDPAGAKIHIDPENGVFQIQTPSGDPIDLKRYAVGEAAWEVVKQMETESANALSRAEKKGNISRDAAATRLAEAQATSLVPAQAAQARAAAGASSARAEALRSGGTGAVGGGGGKYANSLTAYATKHAPVNPLSGKPDQAAMTLIVSLADKGIRESGGKLNAEQAVSQAALEYTRALEAAKRSPAVKAKGYTPEQAVAEIFSRKLRGAVPTAPAPAVDEEE